jgi:hypothetical protein
MRPIHWLLIFALIALILVCLDLSLSQAEVTIDKNIHVGGNGTLYSSARADTGIGTAGNRITGRGEQYLEDSIDMTDKQTTDNTSYALSSDTPWFHNAYMTYTSTSNREYSRYLSTFGSRSLRVQTVLKANDTELRSNIEAVGDAGQLTDVAIDATKKKPIELSRTVVTGPFEIGIKFDAFVPVQLGTDWLPCPSGYQLDNSTAWRPRNMIGNMSDIFNVARVNRS